MSESPTLHDLYAAHDAARKERDDLPREDVRAYWDQGRPAGEVHDTMLRLEQLAAQIDAHPDHRDFETDLRTALGAQIAADDDLAARAYASLCNVDWTHEHGSRYSCSWRYAGGLIAEIRNELNETGEDYLHWYCAGAEGRVDDDLAEALRALGWTAAPVKP